MTRVRTLLKKYWLPALVVAVVIILTAGYALGYRFQGHALTRAGTLVIQDLPQGSLAYIDQARRVPVGGSGTLRLALMPGSHTVIIDMPDEQPWNELFEMTPGTETTLAPIMVPQTIGSDLLLAEKRATALAAIAATRLPSKEAPLLMAGGCAEVYVSGNRILAEASEDPSCSAPAYLVCAPQADTADAMPAVCPPTVIFPSSETITSVIPFPGRKDALVVASGSRSYVLELDPRDPRFVAPIARGSQVRLATSSPSSLFVTDGTDYYEVSL